MSSNFMTCIKTACEQSSTARDEVYQIYLGAMATAPTVDLNGEPLTNKAWYFNTEDGKTYMYQNGVWVTGEMFVIPDGASMSVDELTTRFADLTKHTDMFGVIRNEGSGWKYIIDADHQPYGFTNTIQQGDKNIILFHENPSTQIGSMVITPDETFSKLGLYCGASVGKEYSAVFIYKKLSILVNLAGGTFVGDEIDTDQISLQVGTNNDIIVYHNDVLSHLSAKTISGKHSCGIALLNPNTSVIRAYKKFSGYVYWDGSAFKTANYFADTVKCNVSFEADGTVLVEHDTFIDRFDLQISKYDSSYDVSVVSTTTTSFKVAFSNNGERVTSPDSEFRFFFSRNVDVHSTNFEPSEYVKVTGTYLVDPRKINVPSGNFWVYAKMWK